MRIVLVIELSYLAVSQPPFGGIPHGLRGPLDKVVPSK